MSLLILPKRMGRPPFEFITTFAVHASTVVGSLQMNILLLFSLKPIEKSNLIDLWRPEWAIQTSTLVRFRNWNIEAVIFKCFADFGNLSCNFVAIKMIDPNSKPFQRRSIDDDTPI